MLSFQSKQIRGLLLLSKSPTSQHPPPALSIQLRFYPTPTFLGFTFDCTLSFSKHVYSLKDKFFPCLKALPLRYHRVSLKSPSLFCIMLFFRPFSHMLHLGGFLFSVLPTVPQWNVFTERLVTPSPTASRPTLSHFSSLRHLYLSYELPRLILPCHPTAGPSPSNVLSHFRFGQILE